MAWLETFWHWDGSNRFLLWSRLKTPVCSKKRSTHRAIQIRQSDERLETAIIHNYLGRLRNLRNKTFAWGLSNGDCPYDKISTCLRHWNVGCCSKQNRSCYHRHESRLRLHYCQVSWVKVRSSLFACLCKKLPSNWGQRQPIELWCSFVIPRGQRRN